MPSQQIINLTVLIALPFAGALIGWLMMHKAVFNAETPTKKNQLNALRLLVFLSPVFGIVEAILVYTRPEVPMNACLIAGACSAAAAIINGVLASKQLALGFMNAPERFIKAKNSCTIVQILNIAGFVLFLVLAGII